MDRNGPLKRLLIVILAAAALWGGYWAIGARTAKSGLESWFAERRAEGWQADYAYLSVAGFPNRFDTTFEDLAIADPDTGWAWEAPFFQLLALSYQPNSVIAVFPPESTLAAPTGRATLTAGDLKASLTLSPAPRLPLDRARLVGADLRLEGEDVIEAGVLRLAMERLPGADTAYRHGLLAQDVALPAPLTARLARGVALPDRIARVETDFDMEFDRPWDLDAIERARPQPRHLRLRLLQAEWGALKISATGELAVDAEGRPDGTIAVKAEKWREMLRLAVAAGALTEGAAGSAETALGLIANLSGRPDTLNAELTFRDGGVFLGPVPLGPAPRLRLR